MSSRDFQVGDWILFHWIPYRFYVVSNDDEVLIVTSPAFKPTDTMRFYHWRFDISKGQPQLIGRSKPNPFYNGITKHTGFVHPVLLNTRI